MNESGRKKREWVKTAAIVFLSVMLVLTFFSSTIQNWSLPEVATQYVQSGTITAKATITGNIESVDPYEVKVTETRKVASVAVRVGTEVQKGDTLIYLEDRDSTELEAAKKDLASAQAAYDKAILSDKFTSSDISEAKNGATADNYRNQITRAQNTVKAAENAVKTAENAVKTAEDMVKAAESAGEDVMKPHKAELEKIEQSIQDYQQQIEFDQTINSNSSQKLSEAESAMNSASSELSYARNELNAAGTRLDTAKANLAGAAPADREKLEQAVRDAQNAYDNAEDYCNRCQTAFDEAEAAYKVLSAPRDEREKNILALKDEIARLNVHKYNYQKSVTELENSVKAETENWQKQLDARNVELEERKKELEEKKEALTELVSKAENVSGLQGYLDAIEEAQKKVDELTEKAGGTTITAPISGKITAVNVTAGNETSAAVPVVVMQREGQGFTLKSSVSNDVAKRLSVGDVGSLVNAWRYDDVMVTLASIAPDPDSRGQNKLLTFNVTGSVTAGQSLSFTVGQKSSNYNFIVPNSAIREDNNGKFILIVVSKGSPLGTRYTASRVDVQVIASDETQSAVSGALSGYEFVITTSTKPVEAGNLVRLPD